MKRLTFLLVAIFLGGSFFAQSQELHPEQQEKLILENQRAAASLNEQDPNASPASLIPNKDIFDLLFQFDVGVGGGEYGVATDGEYIYTVAWNSTNFYKYQMDGTYIESFTISGAGNIRDLTFDGQYFYGSANSANIFEMDFTNQTLVSTISASGTIRGIAYDAENDGFWVTSGWDAPLRLISRAGSVVETVTSTEGSFSGLGWENVTDGGPYIWGYTQPTGTSRNILVQIEIATGNTVQTFDITNSVTIGDPDAISGGMVISDLIVPGKWAFLGTAQNDIIWALELADAADADAPAAPTNLVVTAGEMGALNAEIDFNNPDETVDGEPLTDLSAVRIYRSGDLIHTVTDPVIGDPVSYTDNAVPSDGMYLYTVIGENAAGDGLPANMSVYIGEDVPAAPGNVNLVADGNDGLITWDAPTEGYNDGYFTGDNITYTVVRFPDEEEVATGITEETFTDETVPGIGNYFYRVTASNDAGTGGTGESNVALLGADDILLLETFEEEQFPPVGWTWVNGISGSYWERSSVHSYTGTHSARSYQGVASSNLADEWLITPLLDMDNPDAQMLTFYGLSSMAPDGTRENMRILAVDQVYDNVNDLHDNAILLQVIPFEGSWSDHIVDISSLSGDMHLVFNYYITAEDNATFNWIYVDHVMVGDFDTFTLTMMEPVGNGTVTPEVGDHLFMENTEVSLEAVADHTWEFDSWEVNGDFFSDEASTTITITSDVDVQAIFIALDSHTLTMEEPDGEGTVEPEVGDHTYLVGEEVNLLAIPDMGWVFSHWTGEVDDPNSAVTTITMDDDYTVKAYFNVFEGLEIPYSEGFDGIPQGDIPPNWARTHDNWAVWNTNNAGGASAPELRFNWSPSSTDVFRAITPMIDATEETEVLMLEFMHSVNDYSGNYTLKIQTSIDGGDTWTDRWSLNMKAYDRKGNDDRSEGGRDVPPTLETVILSGVEGEEFHIAFVYDGNSFNINQWYVDDIYVGEAPDMYEVTFYVMEDSADEDPIEGASINIDGEIYTTDADGMVAIMMVDDQTYTANITASGYVAEEVTFTVDGEDKTIEVHMMDNIVEPFNLSVITEDMEPGEALFIWNDYGDEYEFRYDDGVVDAQLGFQGTWNSVMGAVHHYEAILHEMTWQLTEEGGPHATVKVWVLGLDANGLPDRNNVKYTAENVPNTDNQWNTYEFTEPVDAPNGFFIGLSYNGFLGLAVDDGVGEPWDFVPGTQFGVFNITDPSSEFTDISVWGFQVNYLLRGYGANLGSINYGKVQTPVATGPAPELIPVDVPYYSGDPKGRDASKVFLGFNVFLNDDLVAEDYMETEYLFTDLPAGEHTAGVQSVYTTGSSDIIEIEFTIDAPEYAYVQIIHNSADELVEVVDIYADGEIVLENVGFRQATPFLEVPAGVDLDLVITPAGEGIEVGVGPITVNFDVDETYIVVAAGIVSDAGYDPAEPFGLFVFDMGRMEAEDPGNTDVLVFHGSTDAPTVSVWETAVVDGEIIPDFSFGDFAGYLELPTMDYILEIRDETGVDVVAAYQAPLETLELHGEALVVLASGFLAPENNSDGPAFGLFVALAEGGDLIALPLFDPNVIHTPEDAEILLYPNPARNELNIVSGEVMREIRVLDMLGQVVYVASPEDSQHQINVNNLKDGVYFVQVLTEKGFTTRKIQITK